ncbi:unnamed protein product [Closterium sp. Naga37s-1]|nr:unnamed protein product [Closterium sp. Naga37s-1]
MRRSVVSLSTTLPPGPVFAVLLALWLLSGLAFAAWLCYSTHAAYLGDRYRRLDTWCYERAKLFEQHTLTTVSQIRTLAGLASVMGKPRGHGNWTWDRCLTEQRWIAYLNKTKYSRPGDTGAMVCLFVTDAERPAFESFYGGPILDTTLSPRQKEPMYCPKLLELHTFRKGIILLIDIMQRGAAELSYMRRTGDIVFSRVVPIADLSLNITGFAVALPILQHALPPNPMEQQAEEAVLGAAGANVDLGSIARHVLQNVFTPDPSITFEVYDITDPKGPAMIYGPGPRLVFYRERDSLPITDISPPNVTRPWEERSVVPLELLGGRLRRYQVWCRYVEAPSTWLSWGVPVLWAALALVVTALIAAVAWQQRVGYMRSEESMAAADQLRAKSRAAERSKSSFVASMSHELRTPMLGIVGLLDALEDRRLSAAQLHDVAAARTAAYDTVRLVNRVLDLSKLEARRMALCCSQFEPRAWLEEVVVGYCELARKKGIEVAGMVDTGVPALLHMDTMRLTQALKELIDNAMCYTTHGHVLVRAYVCPATTSLEDFLHHHLYTPLHPPPPPPRHLFFSWAAYLHTQLGLLFNGAAAACWEEKGPLDEGEGDEDPSQSAVPGDQEQVGETMGDGGGDDPGWSNGGEEMQLVLSCSDTGCGFDSTKEEVSEFKGRSESGGAGLGLVLVHQLVALMGGRVACLSHPGTGSTIAFSVPFARTRRPPAPPPAAAPHTHHAGRADGREGGEIEEEDGRSTGEGWGCGTWWGGSGGCCSSLKEGSWLRGCTGRGRRQGLDARRLGMQGMGERKPCRGEEEEHAGCTRGVLGVAVGVVGPEGSTRELTALMLAGLGAHVHVLPHALDRLQAADARTAEGGTGRAEWSCEDAAREQGGAGEMRYVECGVSGLCGPTGGESREEAGGRGGVGEGGDEEEGREAMPCVVVVNEEDLWWQQGGGAAAGMRWDRDSEPDACKGDPLCGWSGQGGGGRSTGVVALAPGEAAAWQAAAVGLVRRTQGREELVVCFRPLLSHYLHHAVQVAAFGVDSESACHGNSKYVSVQVSPDSTRQAQQGTQQESSNGRSEQRIPFKRWSEDTPRSSSRDGNAGCGEGQKGGSVWGEMSDSGFVNVSSHTVVRSVSERTASLEGVEPSSYTATRRAAAAGAAGAAAGGAGGLVAGWRVLVVDDTAVNLLVARRTLTRCGATVSTAGSGEEAVRRVAAAVSAASDGAAADASAVLDVVLMDLQMPAMDGFMATEAIRELERSAALRSTPTAQAATDGGAQMHTQGGAASHSLAPVTTLTRVPILALTADVDAHITQRCLASGFDGILQKPIDPKQLANLMLRIEKPPRFGPLRTISHPTT